jgi:hypothetical protein
MDARSPRYGSHDKELQPAPGLHETRSMRRPLLLFGGLVALLLAPVLARAGQVRELTLHLFESPHGMRWASPRTLFTSRLANQLTFRKPPRTMGHVAVEVKGPSAPDVLTGMAGSGSKYLRMLRQGGGMAVILEGIPGYLEPAAKLAPELERRYARGTIRFIKVLVSEETEQRLRTFLTEFHARGYDKTYGGPHRPRYGEGSGCSALGCAMLELAGVMSPEMDAAFRKRVGIPGTLIGRPEAGRHVSPLKLLFSKAAGRWARLGEAQTPFTIADPDSMVRWVDQTLAGLAAKPSPGMWSEQRGRGRGVVIDARQLPTPTEPIFLDGK